MNRDTEAVPTCHDTPDVAELRRLAEAATPGPWEAFGAVDGRRGERWLGVTTDMRATESARAGDVFAAQDCTRQDALFIAAANPAAVLGLLARLAHMTEARDNARAEVERLTAMVAETDEPHPDSPNCVIVGGKGVRVTATDLETGESGSVVIDNDYVLICAGDRYQSEVQRHANGTTVLTVKVRKRLAALDGGAES